MEAAVEQIEGALGTWTVAFWMPLTGDPLHGAVERLFFWDGLPAHPQERVFPNGRSGLIAQLDDPYRPGEGTSRDPYPALCIEGLLTKANIVEAPPRRARVIGVSLTPIGAVRLLGTPLGDLANTTHGLEDVVGRAARELGERASGARGARAAIAVTVAWLRERLRRSREIPRDVAWLVREIDVQHGALPVRKIAEALNSPSRLSGAFRAHFGLSPKRYARIVRFRRALELVSDGNHRLADVAGTAGYYDQAHFNAEFAEHAGMTPLAFLSAARYPGSSSLAEGEWDDFSKTGGQGVP